MFAQIVMKIKNLYIESIYANSTIEALNLLSSLYEIFSLIPIFTLSFVSSLFFNIL